MKSLSRSTLTAIVVAVLAISSAACGSSDSDAGGKKSTASGADQVAAQQLISQFTGHPNAFPVDAPLLKPLPAGSRIAYLQCGTPACGLFANFFQVAVEAAGGSFSVVKAGGNTPEALQGAMSSILEMNPSGILIPGIEPAAIKNQLAVAAKKGIAVSADGIADPAQYDIGANVLGGPALDQIGELLAGWTVARKGAETDAVFYFAPELSFTGAMKSSFVAKMSALCPQCNVRVVEIPAASIGTTAPRAVVSDLQAHPKTNVAISVPQEISGGLPAALKVANLEITQAGFGPTPAILAEIKRGAIEAGLGLDIPTMAWTQVDALIRLITGSPLTDGEKSMIPVMQFLEAKDLPADVSKGWAGYPDVADRFTKLWTPSK